MTAMQLTILSVLGLVAIVVSVGLIVDSRLGQPEPATTFAMSGKEDNYARRQAFERPVVTLFQASAADDDWDWRYDSGRKACVGIQVIGSHNTGLQPIEVTGGAIVIGTTGLAEVTMPAGATVYPSMAVTMGSTDRWVIPYLSARVVDSHARAVFHGGVFAEAPGGQIPSTMRAGAWLDVQPVTAHECYGVVKAVWQKQVVIAVGPAFQPENQDITVVISDLPHPTPVPDAHFRGIATWPAEYDTTNDADFTAIPPETANGGTTEGTRHAEDLTTELNSDSDVPGYEWIDAHFFHQSDRVEAGHHSLEIPGCFDSSQPFQRYAVAQPASPTYARAIIIDGSPQTSAWYPSADDFTHNSGTYTIYLSALLLDCRVIGGKTMELKP